MKKSMAFLIAVLLSLPLFAGDFSFSLSAGGRYSTTAAGPLDISLSLEGWNASLYYRNNADINDLQLGYSIPMGKTMNNGFIAHWNSSSGEGGFADLSYVFSQDLSFWRFLIHYGLGLQFGLSYSSLSGALLYSLSPLVELSLGFRLGPMVSTLYMTMMHPEERSWKALVTGGFLLEGFVSERSSIFFDAYIKTAEYLVDPMIMVSGYGLRIGYRFRGTL